MTYMGVNCYTGGIIYRRTGLLTSSSTDMHGCKRINIFVLFFLLSPTKAELALNRYTLKYSNSFNVSNGNKHLQKRTNSNPRRKAAVNFSLCWWTLANRLKKSSELKLIGACPTHSLRIRSLIVFTRACIKTSSKQIWKQCTRNWWKVKT